MSYLYSQPLLEWTTFSCDECGGRLLEEKGFVVCDECGLVNLPPIMQEETVLLKSSSKLATFGLMIGTTYSKDNNGTYYELKKFFIKALAHFDFPEHVKNRSIFLFKNILEYKKTFSEHLDLTKYYTYSIMATSLLVAIREYKLPITTQEVSDYFHSYNFNLTNKHINDLLQELRLYLPVVTPSDYLERVLNPLRYLGDPPYENIDIFIYTHKYLSSCNPFNFCVACVCLAYNTRYGYPKSFILDHFDNSKFAVRSLMKKILEEA